MKVGDRHFLKYAGGGVSTRVMRQEQRAETAEYMAAQVYEKPAGHPDRPDTMDRQRLEREALNHIEPDSPSAILGALRAARPPIPEGQEEAVSKGGPDSPSAILASMGQGASQAPGAQPEAAGGAIVSETA